MDGWMDGEERRVHDHPCFACFLFFSRVPTCLPHCLLASRPNNASVVPSLFVFPFNPLYPPYQQRVLESIKFHNGWRCCVLSLSLPFFLLDSHVLQLTSNDIHFVCQKPCPITGFPCMLIQLALFFIAWLLSHGIGEDRAKAFSSCWKESFKQNKRFKCSGPYIYTSS